MAQAAPAISVVLPAFDAARTVGLALESIRRQTFSDFECIVVDDGSMDATPAIVESIAERDPRFRLITTKHGGIVCALNEGLGACRGEFVARMDADDVAHSRRFELQRAALHARPSWAAVGCHVRFFPRTELSQGLRDYEAWLNGLSTPMDVKRDAFVECPLAHPAAMFRREVLQRFGYRDRGWPEDYDLVLRMLAAGERIGVVPKRLHGWRDGATRLTRTAPACRPERIVACKASFLSMGHLAAAPRYVLWGYGDCGKALGRALAACGHELAAIVELHPGRVGQRIAGAPVITPDGLARFAHLPLVAAVAGPGPRAEIRAWLAARGRQDGVDFVCAA